ANRAHHPPHRVLARSGVRVQDRPRRAHPHPGWRAAGGPRPAPAGWERRARRRGRLPAGRRARGDQHHRFLHAHRGRPVRLWRHRLGQRHQRRVCHGGHADPGHRHPGVAGGPAGTRGGGRGAARRERRLPAGRDSAGGRAQHRRSGAHLRPGRDGHRASRRGAHQHPGARRVRAVPHQAARRRHPDHRAEAGHPARRGLRHGARADAGAQRRGPRAGGGRVRRHHDGRDRLWPPGPPDRAVRGERGARGGPFRRRPAPGRAPLLPGAEDHPRRHAAQLGQLRPQGRPPHRRAAHPPVRPSDQWRPPGRRGPIGPRRLPARHPRARAGRGSLWRAAPGGRRARGHGAV
ncbi:MAG: Selenide,water dikinase, partial [uncultured Gemmatimonadetes bacterium]